MKEFRLWAVVGSVHDGDTLYGVVDHGCGIANKGLSRSGMGLRLYGCNARELHDPGGLAARDNLAQLVPVGAEVSIVCKAWDAWSGRIDVAIELPGVGDLASYLIAQQWAAGPYLGTGVKPVPPWPRTI